MSTVTVPTRFREAEPRGARMGGPLRRLGRVRGEVDEALMARIATALTEKDEPAARVADAIRTRAVSRADLREALATGTSDRPELAGFLALVSDVPAWVDWDLVDRGGQVFRRLGQSAADVLLQLSLIGGYRFGGPTDLLVATGGLTGDQTLRRLAETQHWASALGATEGLRPGGEAWRLTVHVRVMHALVNSSFGPRWDTDRWGLPINMADQAGTLGLFDGTLVIGCRALGVPVPAYDAKALMHLWRYVGWLMGVHPDFLTDDERERHRINYHLLLAAADLSEAGPALAQAILAAQRDRRFPGWPSWLQGLRTRYEQERLLSMLTVFLGRRSMHELGLPLRPPWAYAARVLANTWRYRVRRRVLGDAGLDRLGERDRRRVLGSYQLGRPAGVAALPD